MELLFKYVDRELLVYGIFRPSKELPTPGPEPGPEPEPSRKRRCLEGNEYWSQVSNHLVAISRDTDNLEPLIQSGSIFKIEDSPSKLFYLISRLSDLPFTQIA